MRPILLTILLSSLLIGTGAQGDPTVPSTMNVQGRLMSAEGRPPAPGEKTFVFKIFDSVTAGDELWPKVPDEELQRISTDDEGLWNAQVGAVMPLSADIFSVPQCWLEITVDDPDLGRETLPRILLNTGPYAHSSARAWVSFDAATNSVNSAAIENGSIQLEDLGQNGAFIGNIIRWGTGAAWEIGSVESHMIAANAVGSNQLADSSVGADQLANNCVDSHNLRNGAVQSSDLATNSVLTAKIAAGAVTSDKIADGTIVDANIKLTAAIDPLKIDGNAVTVYDDMQIFGNKRFLGSVAVGSNDPESYKLKVQSTAVEGWSTAFIKNDGVAGQALRLENHSGDLAMLVAQHGTGDIIRCDSYAGGWHPVFKVKNDGVTECDVLEILGGSDLAEPFAVSGAADIVPGTVVRIDPANPGHLRVADQAYDRAVAGIVSGANGLNPGLILRQIGGSDRGSYPVALNGRVYCLADAGHGAIRPGDFLTTSTTPGHAMKAADRERSYGAIIGKAMTALESGQGFVLVLVNLQ